MDQQQLQDALGHRLVVENASFFDFKHANDVLPAIDFMRHPYTGVPASGQPAAAKPASITPGKPTDARRRTQP